MDLGRTFTFEMPSKLVVGPGCSRQVGEELKRLGGSKALVVTDRGVEGAGVLAGILESLSSAGVASAVFNGVEPNPSVRCVHEAAALYRSQGCDCLLGVGGGSSMDTAKIAGVIVANPQMELREMEGMGKFPNPIAPLIAIPTTCGTGSEVSPTGVVTDVERHYKFSIQHVYLYPKVSLIDGNLLTKLPGSVIASTGMDALCHAIESYTTVNNNPIADGIDLKAISMISEWLRPAVANANLEAMSHMVLASTLAGIGFSNTRLTLVHGMSHPVSAHCGVAHGIANAVLLPHVMDFNLIGQPHRFADVARALGEDTFGLTTMEAARLGPKAVRELSRDVGIADSLRAYGVDERHLEGLIEDSSKSPNVGRNPVRANRDDIRAIFLKAMA